MKDESILSCFFGEIFWKLAFFPVSLTRSLSLMSSRDRSEEFFIKNSGLFSLIFTSKMGSKAEIKFVKIL